MANKANRAKSKRVAVVVAAAEHGVETLTPDEKKELKQCESVIKRGWDTFVEVGKALAKVRDARLYRGQHQTFEAYCRVRWQYGKSQAYRLIGAAEVIDRLSPIGDELRMPVNEAQVRPLLALDPEEQVDAWKAALDRAGDGAITAKVVRQAAATFLKSPPKKPKVRGSSKRPLNEARAKVDAAIEALAADDSARASSVLEDLRTLLATLIEES